ncbi:hypothetical protein [Phormidium tenue]|nr:hypothetical protein [Phormidium tenue]MBD2233701.1 hypothetical protein [Phormidium tenue FACHB-1052]
MKNYSWLEVRYYSKGICGGCKSAEWEFRSITTPYQTKAADRSLAHAEQLMAALPQENEGVPFQVGTAAIRSPRVSKGTPPIKKPDF